MRPRTGQLVRTRGGYSARYPHPTELNPKTGKPVRVQTDLETDVLSIAKARMARLLKGESAPETPATPETFRQACERIVPTQETTSTKDRLYRLRTWAYPVFGKDGDLPVTSIKKAHVKEALRRCATAGKSQSTVSKLLGDIATVLRELEDEELITPTPACKVKLPKAKRDKRKRMILSDAEFAKFVAAAPLELAVMAACSRDFGGMRTSDLHAWRWEQIDLETWFSADVPRPKTDDETPDLAIPDSLLEPLVAWWVHAGSPTKGPVFPVRRGPRKGDHKVGKRSYASALRDVLWKAGIHRPFPGVAKATEREHCALQTDSDDRRRPDFHSFRRGYCTGIARTGKNLQTQMALAGHKVAKTAMGYVDLAQGPTRLAAPQNALATPFDFLARREREATRKREEQKTGRNGKRAPSDSNTRPTDSKSVDGERGKQRDSRWLEAFGRQTGTDRSGHA